MGVGRLAILGSGGIQAQACMQFSQKKTRLRGSFFACNKPGMFRRCSISP